MYMGKAFVTLPEVMLMFTGIVTPLVSRAWQTTLFASKTPAQITPPDVTVRTEGLDEV